MKALMKRRNPKRVLYLMLAFSISFVLTFSHVSAGDGKGSVKRGKASSSKTLREKRYYYRAFNRRDPFQSLIVGDYEEGELDLIDIYKVRLVGILSGGYQKFAMLEDDNGYSYIVKAGDRIKNGNIVSVGDRSLIARVTIFGQTNTVTLRLEDSQKKGV